MRTLLAILTGAALWVGAASADLHVIITDGTGFSCPGDGNLDGRVTVDEVVGAVSCAHEGVARWPERCRRRWRRCRSA